MTNFLGNAINQVQGQIILRTKKVLTFLRIETRLKTNTNQVLELLLEKIMTRTLDNEDSILPLFPFDDKDKMHSGCTCSPFCGLCLRSRDQRLSFTAEKIFRNHFLNTSLHILYSRCLVSFQERHLEQFHIFLDKHIIFLQDFQTEKISGF